MGWGNCRIITKDQDLLMRYIGDALKKDGVSKVCRSVAKSRRYLRHGAHGRRLRRNPVLRNVRECCLRWIRSGWRL